MFPAPQNYIFPPIPFIFRLVCLCSPRINDIIAVIPTPPNTPAGPCSLVDTRVDTNPLGFSSLWLEPRLGHMWESKVLLTDGQVFILFFIFFPGSPDVAHL